MCIVIDADMFNRFFNPNDDDMKPLRDWVKNKGKIVYTNFGQYWTELLNYRPMLIELRKLSEVGKAKNVQINKVKAKMKELDKHSLISNDKHILALALADNVKILVSGDSGLHNDFKSIVKGGKIYQNKKYKNLLARYSCP